jgi:hypothetical protein
MNYPPQALSGCFYGIMEDFEEDQQDQQDSERPSRERTPSDHSSLLSESTPECVNAPLPHPILSVPQTHMSTDSTMTAQPSFIVGLSYPFTTSSRPYGARSEPGAGRSPSPDSSTHSPPEPGELVVQPQQQAFDRSGYSYSFQSTTDGVEVSMSPTNGRDGPQSPPLGTKSSSDGGNYVIVSPQTPETYSQPTPQCPQSCDTFVPTVPSLQRTYSEPVIQGPFYYQNTQTRASYGAPSPQHQPKTYGIHHHQPTHPMSGDSYIQDYSRPQTAPTAVSSTLTDTPPSTPPTEAATSFYAPPEMPPPGYGIEPSRMTGSPSSSSPVMVGPMTGSPVMVSLPHMMQTSVGVDSTQAVGGGNWNF